ncbi:MAG: multidrug efflux SMR transporter [Xanthobacteraceae bacterium]|nr:multidrug efflux SMR transporter [Xanthobacteraceae bacterium]
MPDVPAIQRRAPGAGHHLGVVLAGYGAAGAAWRRIRNRRGSMNVWGLLGLCIVAEVTATTLLTKSEGFARPLYGVASIVLFCGCFWALSQVLTRIPVGVAYALWSGLGIALISLTGWLFLRQSLTAMQMVFIGLILLGAIGLNLSTRVS